MDDIFLLVKNRIIEEVGVYDEDYFLQYEEADWCYRVRKRGFRIVYNSKAVIWHGGSFSSGGDLNPTYAFFSPKNLNLFMKKNSSSFKFFKFSLYFLFIYNTKKFIYYIKKKKTSLVKNHLKGIISGYKQIVSK